MESRIAASEGGRAAQKWTLQFALGAAPLPRSGSHTRQHARCSTGDFVLGPVSLQVKAGRADRHHRTERAGRSTLLRLLLDRRYRMRDPSRHWAPAWRSGDRPGPRRILRVDRLVDRFGSGCPHLVDRRRADPARRNSVCAQTRNGTARRRPLSPGRRTRRVCKLLLRALPEPTCGTRRTDRTTSTCRHRRQLEGAGSYQVLCCW